MSAGDSSDAPLTLIGRNVTLAVLGVLALVFKESYAGGAGSLVYAYAGNVAVSFALYFALLGALLRIGYPRLVSAAVVLAVVTAFEVMDGFGAMANVYDPLDIAANAAGIGFGVLIDMGGGPQTLDRSAASRSLNRRMYVHAALGTAVKYASSGVQPPRAVWPRLVL